MNILLGVTGGIAAYKACDLINALRKDKHEVRVVMTRNATEFITPLTLSSLSGNEVLIDMWKEREGQIGHISVSKWAHALIVYPATANIIGKFVNGLADDLLSTIWLSLGTKHRIVCPAMNTEMWNHIAVFDNVSKLREVSLTQVLGPIRGHLACGDMGVGKVVEVSQVVELIKDIHPVY